MNVPKTSKRPKNLHYPMVLAILRKHGMSVAKPLLQDLFLYIHSSNQKARKRGVASYRKSEWRKYQAAISGDALSPD